MTRCAPWNEITGQNSSKTVARYSPLVPVLRRPRVDEVVKERVRPRIAARSPTPELQVNGRAQAWRNADQGQRRRPGRRRTGRAALGRSRAKLDNLFWNIIDTANLVAKLVKVFRWVIQHEHTCSPDRTNNMLRRIKSANEHHGCLAMSVKARDFVKGN
jgi:hypothetical protein